MSVTNTYDTMGRLTGQDGTGAEVATQSRLETIDWSDESIGNWAIPESALEGVVVRPGCRQLAVKTDLMQRIPGYVYGDGCRCASQRDAVPCRLRCGVGPRKPGRRLAGEGIVATLPGLGCRGSQGPSCWLT